MANKNTIARALFTPLTVFQGISSTAEVTATGINESAQADVTEAIRLEVPANLSKDREIVVKIGGRLNFGAGTFKVDLYDGLFDASGVKLATSTALTPAAGNFLMVVHLTSDPTSDDAQGFKYGHLGNTIIPLAVLEAAATWNPEVSHNLSVSFDWGSSNAGNGLQLRTFEVEAL